MRQFGMMVLILVVPFVIHGRVHADDDAAKKDGKLLEGRWRLVSVEVEGKATELGDDGPIWVIKGNKVAYAGDPLAALTIHADTNPKSIDLAWAEPKKTYEGIYVIDRDTLKLCMNHQTDGAKDRPQEFTTAGKSNLRLLVFQRDKAENADPLAGVSGFVGVMIGYDADKKNVIIVNTIEGSPAKKAGLLKDDVVVSVGGANATDLQTVVGIVRRQKPGQEIMIKVKRGDKEKEITIKVGKLPFIFLD